MAKTQHTPGPWKLEQLEESRNGYVDWDTFTIRDGKTNGCLAVVGQVDRQFEQVNEANARLIASAPELLAACESGVKFLDSLLAGNGMSGIQLRMLSENRMAFRKILEAAIAKATT